MKTSITIILIAFTILSVSSGFAVTWSELPQRRIESITAEGTYSFIFVDQIVECGSSTSDGSLRIGTNGTSTEERAHMNRTALAAFLAGRPVKFDLQEEMGRCRIKGLRIE